MAKSAPPRPILMKTRCISLLGQKTTVENRPKPISPPMMAEPSFPAVFIYSNFCQKSNRIRVFSIFVAVRQQIPEEVDTVYSVKLEILV